MSKIIEKIVSQALPPKDTNVGWWNGKELKFYSNGQWKTSGGSSGESFSSSIRNITSNFNPLFIDVDAIPKYGSISFDDYGITQIEEDMLNLTCISRFGDGAFDNYYYILNFGDYDTDNVTVLVSLYVISVEFIQYDDEGNELGAIYININLKDRALSKY